jgi:hypothetical protein
VEVLGSDLGVGLGRSDVDWSRVEVGRLGLGPMGPGWRSGGRPAGSDKRACVACGRSGKGVRYY